MGGYGSGRTGYKQKAGACKSISVNRLHGEGCLIVGRAGNWIWSLDGEETGRISYHMTEGGLALAYKIRQHGGDWESVAHAVPITYVVCNF